MARKKIGHVELQWTCPNCASLNPGPEKLCGNCGAPQPKDVEFFQAKRQELISDEGKLRRLKQVQIFIAHIVVHEIQRMLKFVTNVGVI